MGYGNMDALESLEHALEYNTPWNRTSSREQCETNRMCAF